jgi:hypothetical protein
VRVCTNERYGVGEVYKRAVWWRADRSGRVVKWVAEAEVCSVVVEGTYHSGTARSQNKNARNLEG